MKLENRRSNTKKTFVSRNYRNVTFNGINGISIIYARYNFVKSTMSSATRNRICIDTTTIRFYYL